MIPSILILGAGRSSSLLISWLLNKSAGGRFSVTVGDVSPEAARYKIRLPGQVIQFDVTDAAASSAAIRSADVVISVLPPPLHPRVAALCLEHGKHLITASYVSSEMSAFDTAAKDRNLLFLNECGLDPGLDHMSAMQLIDHIKRGGGELISFESFTGGLIAPDTDLSNPWRYKFTWNPRNVVMAGQGTAKFLEEGHYKYIPYQRLFRQITNVSVPGFGEFEGYVNRDSLKYREAYGLPDIKTMIRGTLRYKGYCRAWDVLVQLGCTDDTWSLERSDATTHRTFINSFLPFDPVLSVEQKLCERLSIDPSGPEIKRLTWSGFFTDEPIGHGPATPAQITEHILNKRWKLDPSDKDFVVMWHRFVYNERGVKKELQASLTATGDNAVDTAMAKTVGLPLAMAAVLLLEGKIKARGVQIPTIKEIYDPILAMLKEEGIQLAHH